MSSSINTNDSDHILQKNIIWHKETKYYWLNNLVRYIQLYLSVFYLTFSVLLNIWNIIKLLIIIYLLLLNRNSPSQLKSSIINNS